MSSQTPPLGYASDAPTASAPAAKSRNALFGMILFIIYCAIYGGFVWLSAFNQDAMKAPVGWAGGMNLAVVYGITLIVAAFVLAMIYMFLCLVAGDREEPVAA